MENQYTEDQACHPIPVDISKFNRTCRLPYDLTIMHVKNAMTDFIDFLGFVNTQLYTRNMTRLESFLMPANFSSIVGEFMNSTIPNYCLSLTKNGYHNGHPDLIPTGYFPRNSVQYAHEGLEVKGSRHLSGWQGHNPESVWLMVFCFDSNTSGDKARRTGPKPFVFKAVYAAKLEMEDWNFSGRSADSRRTITASVNQSGIRKMRQNWVYEDLR